MAYYVITDAAEVNWEAISWNDLPRFKYLRNSTDGHPTAEAEFARRQAAGLPTVLWELDYPRSDPKIIGQCNI